MISQPNLEQALSNLYSALSLYEIIEITVQSFSLCIWWMYIWLICIHSNA